MQVPGMIEPKAQMLVQRGVMSIADLSDLSAEDITRMLKISEQESETLVSQVKAAVNDGTLTLTASETADFISASAIPAYKGTIEKGSKDAALSGQDKFSEAEKRLREELAAFKLK